MFVLYPDGKGGPGGAGNSSDALRQKLWFFGQLGLYYGLLHGAYLFMNGRGGNKTIEAVPNVKWLKIRITNTPPFQANMALTEEQRERIRKNRERALQIQKDRREKQKLEKTETKEENHKPTKKRRTEDSTTKTASTPKASFHSKGDEEFHSSEPLEDFEEGASAWVTKTEAMNTYCLPEGSIAVCSYEERKNPRNPGFKPMKLYRRAEIRYRAHKRHGGLQGLISERNKRRQRKLEKEMEAARDIFK